MERKLDGKIQSISTRAFLSSHHLWSLNCDDSFIDTNGVVMLHLKMSGEHLYISTHSDVQLADLAFYLKK